MLVTTWQKRSKLNDDTLHLMYKDVNLQMISYDKSWEFLKIITSLGHIIPILLLKRSLRTYGYFPE